MLPGRATSLRTRAFGVIVMVVLIPSFCLAALGVWAYYRSWETAAVSVHGPGVVPGRGAERGDRVGSSAAARPFTPAERAALDRAIVQQYGARGHPRGRALAQPRARSAQTSTCFRPGPYASLRRRRLRHRLLGVRPRSPCRRRDRGVALPDHAGAVLLHGLLGRPAGRSQPRRPSTVSSGSALLGVALIVVLGLLGAWILSRSVVRPVRRLAEASGRLAEGEAGVTVTPQGPTRAAGAGGRRSTT